MCLVFDFLKNGLSGVVSHNHLYFSPPLSNFKGGSFEPFEPFEPPLLRACEVNTDANFVTSSYQKISGFDRPPVSKMLSDSNISTLESGFKSFRICLRIRRMRVDDSRIQKEKVADSKISGYVWTGFIYSP